MDIHVVEYNTREINRDINKCLKLQNICISACGHKFGDRGYDDASHYDYIKQDNTVTTICALYIP